MSSLALAGCALPRSDAAVLVHDFGPGARHSVPDDGPARLAPLDLAPVQASAALGSTAVLYRLTYADAQQPRPYALARWSMPPAQLLEQRLRERLSLRRAVLVPGDIVLVRSTRASATPAAAPGQTPLTLRVELEEFSQLFASPQTSSALVRLRATVLRHGATGDGLLAQRSFIAEQAAPSADARGGVQALTAAADQAIAELETWLAQIPQ